METPFKIQWTDYLQYRAKLRGFDLSILEEILRHSTERYYDTETGRKIVVGNHKKELLLIAYEVDENVLTPVTVHTITRQQVNFRLKTERFIYE